MSENQNQEYNVSLSENGNLDVTPVAEELLSTLTEEMHESVNSELNLDNNTAEDFSENENKEEAEKILAEILTDEQKVKLMASIETVVFLSEKPITLQRIQAAVDENIQHIVAALTSLGMNECNV